MLSEYIVTIHFELKGLSYGDYKVKKKIYSGTGNSIIVSKLQKLSKESINIGLGKHCYLMQVLDTWVDIPVIVQNGGRFLYSCV